MDRAELRKEIRERIRGIDRKAESRAILSILTSLEEYRDAPVILAYSPLSDEPDISELLQDGRVLLPYITGRDMRFSSSRILHRSPYGFMEPEGIEAPYDRALMLVPLLGYNPRRCRLGRGGGFYDRYIRNNRKRITTIGLAFSVSFDERFKEEPHDAVLDAIITPEGRIPAS